MKQRVLILGSNDRAALAVARSLGRNGVEVDVGRLGESSIAERSRFVTTTIDFGAPALGVSPVAERLLNRLSSQKYSLVIPINDSACVLSQRFREEIEKRAPLALPNDEAFEASHDKGKTMSLCDELAISRPPSELLSSWDDVSRLRNQPDRFPGYVKPACSARIVSGRMSTFSVARAETFDDLEEEARFNLDRVPLLFQEPVSGVGVGIHFLADNGRILSIAQQQRLHEPRRGGGGSYRRTVVPDHQFTDWAERIADRLSWHGVAMIELKVDVRTRAAAVMEINGRFWGSLPLTLRAGLDLPVWLLELYSGKPPDVIRTTARPNVKQRNLRRDVLWVVREMKGARGMGEMRILGKWLRIVPDVILGREGLDTESLSDPKPGLAEWGDVMESGLRRIRSILPRISSRGSRMRRERVRLLEVVEQFGREPRVLFICTGNICRSAFAGVFWKHILGMAEVRSAGLVQHFDRRPPRIFEDIALREYGVDLRGHRSRTLDQELLAWADIVLVMDENMERGVGSRNGIQRSNVFSLGNLTEGGDIPDPLHESEEKIREILTQLVHAIESLRDMITKVRVGKHPGHPSTMTDRSDSTKTLVD